ncbi:MAG TPA: UDP-3-O-(3-hydroxymyristoyl)glucosamine N-acyltransferase [Bryobacteraceae bacterium]
MSLTVAELARICGGTAEGETARPISGASALESAMPNDVAFVSGKKAMESAATSQAGCLLVPPEFDLRATQTLIRVSQPRAAFGRAILALYPPKRFSGFIHPSAVIAGSAKISADAFVGAHTVIGAESEIGTGTYIGSGCSIGDRVHIGPESVIHPNVTIYDAVRAGARAIVHSGSVIGADGFGFTLSGDCYEKFPQIGTVEIGDDVEIGANCCIDRAALGVTRIGNGTKFDNLVHVGHNCTIGNHVVVAAQTGFSGGVSVGDYAVIGGQAGIGEKARIEARAVIGGKAGVLTSQRVRAGEPVWGIPARPLRKHLKNLAYINRLAEFREEVEELKRKLSALERSQQLTKS